MSDHLSIGVIGHVDHGKTTLVKALTGTETDRLEEEKRRGLTIVLGFAFRETPSGIIDFIDAPGHADFVRTMISGATGIDAALIVVAANEGIMPQTLEHIRIASLLGIDKAVVALTKTDLSSEEETAQTAQNVQSLLLETGFQDPTIVPVSALSEQGLPQLVAALEGLFDSTPRRADGGAFYLPFDRVFTVRGFGTVATGTLRAGVMSVDDVGEISPLGASARVRGMEVHGKPADRAEPGQRVAVNIRTDASLERGQALASTGLLAPAALWDASLQLTDDIQKPLKNGTPVRVLHGTTETQAAIRLLDRDRLLPGEAANVQLRLRVPAAAWDQDRFILRTVSPVATIGGGRFLNTQARRRKRFDDTTMDQLQAVGGDDAVEAFLAHLAQAGLEGVALADLSQRFAMPDQQVRQLVGEKNGVVGADSTVYGGAAIEGLAANMLQLVGAFHEDQPSRLGIGKPALISGLSAPTEAVALVLDRLADDGQLLVNKGQISLPGFDPFAALSEAKRAHLDRLEAHIKDAAMMPPSMGEVTDENPQDKKLAELLIEVGRVLPLYDHKRTNLFLFHRAAIDDAVVAMQAAFPPPAEFRVGDVRAVLDSTRKYMIPFLTWLDRQNITRRADDMRQMTKINAS
jgi:selenocysteine-specific elongation factor